MTFTLAAIDPMAIILAIFVIVILWSLYVAHRHRTNKFDAFDLIMENDAASVTRVAFMLVLGVSTWIVVDTRLKGQLDVGMFGLWLGAWVTPLVARVVFGRKDPPAAVAEETTTTRTVTPAAPVPQQEGQPT